MDDPRPERLAGTSLFDTNSTNSKEFIQNQIVKCIDLAKGGVHGVLYVVSVKNRFTAEEAAVLDSLQLLFGPDIINYMVVVFTGGDELENDGVAGSDATRTAQRRRRHLPHSPTTASSSGPLSVAQLPAGLRHLCRRLAGSSTQRRQPQPPPPAVNETGGSRPPHGRRPLARGTKPTTQHSVHCTARFRTLPNQPARSANPYSTDTQSSATSPVRTVRTPSQRRAKFCDGVAGSDAAHTAQRRRRRLPRSSATASSSGPHSATPLPAGLRRLRRRLAGSSTQRRQPLPPPPAVNETGGPCPPRGRRPLARSTKPSMQHSVHCTVRFRTLPNQPARSANPYSTNTQSSATSPVRTVRTPSQWRAKFCDGLTVVKFHRYRGALALLQALRALVRRRCRPSKPDPTITGFFSAPASSYLRPPVTLQSSDPYRLRSPTLPLPGNPSSSQRFSALPPYGHLTSASQP
ncbi:uncharacterized protein LOC131874315 [Cryptomeria japonica]|uniref:uncharacterized protein LOC131874315 n=1 Tax=Cryptomeria japonica TaxID=3369 RepID=UPI0027DA6439|nr:uncharacterized protein LOC131874315 [Cryptomeria japonica]